MIGTPVCCTIWQVDWCHRKIEPPSRLVLLKLEEEDKTPKYQRGQCLVLTADPTGDDLVRVSERSVLGAAATKEHEFTLTHVHRVGDAKGLAQVELTRVQQ
jgi:hypothetical protein